VKTFRVALWVGCVAGCLLQAHAHANREACRTLEVWNSALAAYDHNAMGLELRYPPYGYFDAHTHWNGILDWRTFVAAYAKDGKPENLYRFLVARLEALRREENVSPRLTPVADALLTDRCLEKRVSAPGLSDSGPRRKAGDYDFETTLEAVLSATPYTEFDSAYYVRGLVTDAIAEKTPLAGKYLNLAITADQEIGFITSALRSQGILYSEQFVSPKKIESLTASQETVLRKAGVVLFVQFVNVFLAQNGERTWLKAVPTDRGGTRCAEEPGKDLLEKQSALLARLPELVKGNPLVRGVDILAPERNCIGDHGLENLNQLATELFGIARSNGRRMVLHIHIGEGYPIFPTNQLERLRSEAYAQCDLNLTLPVPMVSSAGVPLHYGNARENVRRVLGAVEDFRRSAPADLDDWLKIRFGHVTHLDANLAKRIAAANVDVDVDLTSNLVTGALTTALPGNTSMASCTTAAYRSALDDAMRSHSLMYLLDNNVNTVLGTDGAGVEHSSFLQEYKWVAVIADRYFAQRNGEVDPPPGAVLQYPTEVNRVIARIQRSSSEHVCWMRGDEGWRMEEGVCLPPK